MVFINSSHLLAATSDTVNEVNMETLHEKTYAGLDNYTGASVFTGHRIRDVRFTKGYGITFDGNQTIYLSLRYGHAVLAIDIDTDEVKVEVQSSPIYPHKLYFDTVTNDLLITMYDTTCGRHNIGKWNLVSKELSLLLSCTFFNSSITVFGFEVQNPWRTDLVHVDGSVWMVGQHHTDIR